MIVLRFPTPIQNFTDLCSIANISLMVFDKEFHGYYLHGMSPSGTSEGSIGELKRALELEAKGSDFLPYKILYQFRNCKRTWFVSK